MDLRELLGGEVAGLIVDVHIPELPGYEPGRDPRRVEIGGVVHDTNDVDAAALFCCVRGARVDGHALAGEAVAMGAAALLVDHPVGLHELAAQVPDDMTGEVRVVELAVPQVVVRDVREAMGPIAARFWHEPSRALEVIGVTGTAGKTTVTHLVQAIWAAAGRPCGVVGTLSGARTTPDATELQELLAEEVEGGSRAVAVEVSSHGLELHRVDGTRFAVAVFTNLSRDHLDFHRTMDAYFAAKARLFTPGFTGRAVVCADDPWGRRLLDELAAAGNGVEVLPYGLDDAADLQLGPDGARFGWQGEVVELALPGRFNVLNALAAATAARAVGIEVPAIAAGLRAAGPVPGRFEPVDAGQPFTVLVDYSHKPDALEQALLASRELAPKGQLTVVFGCGGDKDTGKRPIMGEVAARLADRVVLTSDNPRSEDPLAIIDEIRAGIRGPATPAEVVVEPDRRRAIARAVGDAGPGDLVLVAGKGHETLQYVGLRVLRFDDRAVARDVLAGIGYGGGGDSGGAGGEAGPGSGGTAG
jgi:UDP-N-acetylmuramoyl-L-alanyl-D-glutamate--2,6-diaminopimelate ligase